MGEELGPLLIADCTLLQHFLQQGLRGGMHALAENRSLCLPW